MFDAVIHSAEPAKDRIVELPADHLRNTTQHNPENGKQCKAIANNVKLKALYDHQVHSQTMYIC